MENLIKPRSYHSISAKRVLKVLKTSSKGLSDFEAQGRLDKLGENKLPEGKKFSALTLFFRQFNSPLMFIILTAAGLSFLIGHWIDALFITFVILINTTVGFFQENKAEKTLEKLNRSVKFYCSVIRQEIKKRILSKDLVVGDIIEIREGDKIPADARLIETRGLKTNEAMLTGESMPQEKNNKILPSNTIVADRNNMIFMGTVAEEGWALAVVIATGEKTELGKISCLVKKEEDTKTPLQKKFRQLSRQMGVAIVIAIAIFSAVSVFRGGDWYEIFITSIALIVSAVPEGLLPAITVILILGMRRLARKKALVRKLNATESMGAITTICMDKTGTLTCGEMQVSHIITGAKELLHEENEIKNISFDKNLLSHLKTLEIATLVNDAYIENPQDEFSKRIVRGRPTDSALLSAGISAGLEKKELEKELILLDKLYFNSKNKYAANVYQTKDNGVLVYLLGAPEEVIKRSEQVDINGRSTHIFSTEGKKLFQRVDNLTAQGLRLLACGMKKISLEEYKKYKNNKEKWGNLGLTGFIALRDPLRKDVSKSISVACRAGIRPIIITGDHKNTTKSIMSELGISTKENEILEGKDLNSMVDRELEKKINKISIFTRVAPIHKIRIVRALQSRGEVVAMVGDGVNDAPALKAADVGIAVETGTDISKEVADIILLDNSFSVIVKAIEQGRLMRQNIRRVITYLVADDFSEIFLFFSAIIMGLPFPLYPMQILWINLVEDSFPDIALTAEKETAGLMNESPPNPKEPILNREYKKFMLSVFFVSGMAAFFVFYFSWNFFGDLEKSRTLTFALVAFDSLFFAFLVRYFRRSVFNRQIFSNKILNGAVLISFLILLAGIYLPFFQKLLKTVPLSMADWGVIIAISTIELLILEKFKLKFIKSI